MSSAALPFALLYGLVLAELGATLLGALCMQRMMRAAAGRAETLRAQCEAAVEAVRKDVEACSRQLLEVHMGPPEAPVPGLPGPGLNLSKRSQALRMSRRGDTPEQVAAALAVPLQEVDLLLKVHRIVIDSHRESQSPAPGNTMK
jgi:hypothetical protein